MKEKKIEGRKNVVTYRIAHAQLATFSQTTCMNLFFHVPDNRIFYDFSSRLFYCLASPHCILRILTCYFRSEICYKSFQNSVIIFKKNELSF